MTDSDSEAALRRENIYLKARVAQLEDDVTSLGSQLTRLQQERERISTRMASRPDPLSSGQ